jgi:hypothetical protein
MEPYDLHAPGRSGRDVAIPDLLGSRAVGSLWLSLALACLLVPAWVASGAVFNPDIHVALASPWMPAALALLLSVRAGGLNLGVWGMAALGAVAAWWAISTGLTVPTAVLIALAVGAAAGAVQAALTTALDLLLARRLRPAASGWAACVIASSLISVAALAVARSIATAAALKRLRLEMIAGYNDPHGLVLLSAMFLATTLALLFMIDRRIYRDSHHVWAPSRRVALAAASVGGGMLAAISGVILLLSRSEFRASPLVVGDLRIVAAVLLAGAWVWRGRGSALLAAAILPLGMLVTTIWREIVLLPASVPAMPPLLPLIVLVAGLQAVLTGHRFRRLRMAAGLACGAGILTVAVSSFWILGGPHCRLVLGGLALWLLGMSLGFYRWLCRRAPLSPPVSAPPP